MSNTNYLTGSHLGAALATTVSSANSVNSGGAIPTFTLGQRGQGNNNSQWMYVYASAIITQYALVGVQASGTAGMLTSTQARSTTPRQLAIAQVAFAAGDYGWVAAEGAQLTVLTTAVCTAGNKLFTTATAGRVSTTQATAADAQVQGLIHSVTTGSTASTAPCIANNLTFGYPTLLTTG